MKSHMLLLRAVLADASIRCCASTTRDLKTIARRVEHEGLSYLTIALPDFCKDFERGLRDGKVDSTSFKGYSKNGCLPKLFSGFTSQVFDMQSGELLNEPNIDCIQAIRQVTLLFGKVNLPCSDARVAAAFDKYIECELDVRANDHQRSEYLTHSFRHMAVRVWGNVLRRVDQEIHDLEVIPKHGPGVTADRLLGNAKYDQTVWTRRLEEVFPHEEFLFPSWNPLVDSSDVIILEPEAEIPVKVITVPKTLKTPRIIAIEPTCMQYAQQAVSRSLVRSISRDDILGKIVGFDDQDVNRVMALRGSRDGSLATLDLSEASDRVSNQLVQELGHYFPWFSAAIDATRSRTADVPGFGVQRLAKYASMGSALCFPIEAMVFATIILLGIEWESNSPLSQRDLEDLVGKVRVYGDDIIVPVEYARSSVRILEAFGLKVNANKSFWTGWFRESCGKEYYAGEDVSVVRVRALLPTQRRHVPEIISTVSLRNQMYFAGYWETARFLDEWLERLIPFPTVLPESPALGRHSHLGYETQRMCPQLHRPLVRAYKVRATLPPSKLDGRGALLKYFLTHSETDEKSEQPVADRNHLERAGRPKAVNIKLGWVSST